LPKEQTTAKLSGAVAVPVLLNVQKDGAKLTGQLIDFKTNHPWYEYPPVEFNTTIKNDGNIHFKPKGAIFIKDFLGRDVATISFNKEGGNILPNSSRTFQNNWSDGFVYYEEKQEDGQPVLGKDGKPEKKLTFRFDKLLDFRFGKYTAYAVIAISDNKKDYTFESNTSFWIFPWKIILGALVFITFTLLGIANTFKSVFKKIFRFLRKFGSKGGNT
jgi:hypothetical protein